MWTHMSLCQHVWQVYEGNTLRRRKRFYVRFSFAVLKTYLFRGSFKQFASQFFFTNLTLISIVLSVLWEQTVSVRPWTFPTEKRKIKLTIHWNNNVISSFITKFLKYNIDIVNWVASQVHWPSFKIQYFGANGSTSMPNNWSRSFWRCKRCVAIAAELSGFDHKRSPTADALGQIRESEIRFRFYSFRV